MRLLREGEGFSGEALKSCPSRANQKIEDRAVHPNASRPFFEGNPQEKRPGLGEELVVRSGGQEAVWKGLQA